MATADERYAERATRQAAGVIFRLKEEKQVLLQAQVRITEIDEEIAVWEAELLRLAPRVPPPREETPTDDPRTR
jgi:Tfp pilus assembly protein PilN